MGKMVLTFHPPGGIMTVEGRATMPSKFRGISYHKRHGHWRAKITAHGRDVHLGNWKRADHAARMYDCAATLLRGKQAFVNFDGLPPEGVTVEDVRQIIYRQTGYKAP